MSRWRCKTKSCKQHYVWTLSYATVRLKLISLSAVASKQLGPIEDFMCLWMQCNCICSFLQ